MIRGKGELVQAAEKVVACWEQGDLAAAVRYLALTLQQTDEYHLTGVQGRTVRDFLDCYLDDLLEQKREIEQYDSRPDGDSSAVRAKIKRVTDVRNLFS